jgi:hypothetical protein
MSASLAAIRRSVRPGQLYSVTCHQEPGLGPVVARVDRLTGTYGFYLRHALGESKVSWPAARNVSLDANGTLHLRDRAFNMPFLTLVPASTSRGEAPDAP